MMKCGRILSGHFIRSAGSQTIITLQDGSLANPADRASLRFQGSVPGDKRNLAKPLVMTIDQAE